MAEHVERRVTAGGVASRNNCTLFTAMAAAIINVNEKKKMLPDELAVAFMAELDTS